VPLQQPGPVMRSTAGFHANLAAWLDSLQHCLEPFLAVELFTPDWLLEAINAMNLKHILCQINPNANKLHAGVLL
jgi:hypothetical protein